MRVTSSDALYVKVIVFVVSSKASEIYNNDLFTQKFITLFGVVKG